MIRDDLRVLVDVVCEVAGLHRSEVLGPRVLAPFVHARHVIMFLARGMLGLSYPYAAQLLGGRDHTTVLHACRVTAREIAAGDGRRLELLVDVVERFAQRAHHEELAARNPARTFAPLVG